MQAQVLAVAHSFKVSLHSKDASVQPAIEILEAMGLVIAYQPITCILLEDDVYEFVFVYMFVLLVYLMCEWGIKEGSQFVPYHSNLL